MVTLVDVEEACSALFKWIEPNDPKVFYFLISIYPIFSLQALVIAAKQAVASAHYGIALRCLQKVLDDKGASQSLIFVSRAIVEVVYFFGSFD